MINSTFSRGIIQIAVRLIDKGKQMSSHARSFRNFVGFSPLARIDMSSNIFFSVLRITNDVASILVRRR